MLVDQAMQEVFIRLVFPLSARGTGDSRSSHETQALPRKTQCRQWPPSLQDRSFLYLFIEQGTLGNLKRSTRLPQTQCRQCSAPRQVSLLLYPHAQKATLGVRRRPISSWKPMSVDNDVVSTTLTYPSSPRIIGNARRP